MNRAVSSGVPTKHIWMGMIGVVLCVMCTMHPPVVLSAATEFFIYPGGDDAGALNAGTSQFGGIYTIIHTPICMCCGCASINCIY